METSHKNIENLMIAALDQAGLDVAEIVVLPINHVLYKKMVWYLKAQ